MQDLWQVHYQILSIIFLKKFIELNLNSDTMIKNAKHVKLNISIATVFLNTQILKIIEYQCLCCNKSYHHKFEGKLKEQFFNIYKFSNHENKKFILLMSIWMIGKNSIKHHYLKKKIFRVT